MAVWSGCEIPEDRFYDVERDVWVRLEDNGDVTLGMTDPAQVRAGRLAHMLIKRVGKRLDRYQSAATIESAKWAGPFPTPLTGTIVENNQDAFREDILVANRDPYGAGWIVRLRPESWDVESAELTTGDAAVARYKERIKELDITCFRCQE